MGCGETNAIFLMGRPMSNFLCRLRVGGGLSAKQGDGVEDVEEGAKSTCK